MQTIWKGITVNLDKQSVINNLKDWDYNEEEFDFYSECGCDTDAFSVSEEEFITKRDNLIKLVEEMDEDKLSKLCDYNVNLTAKGKVPSRRNFVLDEGIVTEYDDMYGSHKLTHYALMARKSSDISINVVMDNYVEQSSF